MIKKLSIFILAAMFVSSPVMSQQKGSSENASFRPQKGNFQVSLNMGSGRFFKDSEGLNYLLPKYVGDDYSFSVSPGDTGLPGKEGVVGGNVSGDIGAYLNLGSFNSNSVTNIIGIQGAYFITNEIQVNASFSMDISQTPRKDYTEGAKVNEGSYDYLDVPGVKAIEGRVSNQYMVSVGANYYFATKAERVQLYAGVNGAYRGARLDTSMPYTGVVIGNNDDSGTGKEDPIELYRPQNKAGRIYSTSVAAIAGIEFSCTSNLILGFEFAPFQYTNSVIQIQPQGSQAFYGVNNNYKIFSMPTLKLGIRF